MKSLFLIFSLVVATYAEESNWWDHGTFYQIYVRSFKDSDGDGIGDINGIIEKLDHLKDLGVNGFWLGPVFRSPMVDGGYDISDFRDVDPLFGSLENLTTLIEKAHELDLKILLDFVPNHTSDRHDWFILSQNRTPGYEDFYVWRNCPLVNGIRTLPNNWISVFHTSSWTYSPVREQCYFHQFTAHQPDLNYRNPRVIQEMLDVLTFWLQRGVDGFRIDALRTFETLNHPPEVILDINGDRTSRENIEHLNTISRPESYSIIQKFRNLTDEFSKNATDAKTRIIICDTYGDMKTQARWYGLEDQLGAHIPLNSLLTDHERLHATSSATDFRDEILDMFDSLPVTFDSNWVLGNHDIPRISTRFGEGKHEAMAILSLMLPGPNMIYYGEEILMVDHNGITFEESDDPQAILTNSTVFRRFSRDPARTPFQWNDGPNAGFSNTTSGTFLPVHPHFMFTNLQVQKDAKRSTFKLYQQLIELRNTRETLKIGSLSIEVVNQNTLALMRTLRDHPTIAVYIHFGPGDSNIQLKDFLGDEYHSALGNVLAATSRSSVHEGFRVGDNQNIHMQRFDAFVIEISSARKTAASMFVFCVILMKFIF